MNNEGLNVTNDSIAEALDSTKKKTVGEIQRNVTNDSIDVALDTSKKETVGEIQRKNVESLKKEKMDLNIALAQSKANVEILQAQVVLF